MSVVTATSGSASWVRDSVGRRGAGGNLLLRLQYRAMALAALAAAAAAAVVCA